MAVSLVMGRGDLTKAEWARLKPHLPQSGQRGGRWASRRKMIYGTCCPDACRLPDA